MPKTNPLAIHIVRGFSFRHHSFSKPSRNNPLLLHLTIITRSIAIGKQLRMENPHQVFQQVIGTHRKLLIIIVPSGIASINITPLEGIKCRVRRIFRLQIGVRHLPFHIVFYQPEVGMNPFIQYCLKRKRHSPCPFQVTEKVIGTGIFIETCHITVAGRNIPRRAEPFFRNHRRTV